MSSVVPTGVTWYAFPPRAVVHFSGALTSGSPALSSWFARRSNERWTVSGVSASGSDATVYQGGVVGDVGADEVTYDGVAGDLLDAAGDPIAAFTV